VGSYGNYDPDAGESHGYVRDRKGRFTINDFPGARVSGNYKNNNRGQVVGNYSVENRIVTQHAAELGDLVVGFLLIDQSVQRTGDRSPGRRKPQPGRPFAGRADQLDHFSLVLRREEPSGA
jgi:hypothetical protein